MIRYLVCGLVFLNASLAYTQSVVSQNPYQGATTAKAGLGLDASVSVSVQSVALKNVLIDIASQMGSRAVFSNEVRDSKRLISLKVANVSARHVLDEVLRGTGIIYKLYSSGELAFAGAASRNLAGGVVTGKVSDVKTGRGVSGANVSVDHDTRGVITSDDGSYRISGVAVGNRTLTVRLVGYAKQVGSVVVGEGATVVADFKLDPSASVLDQVVVTGTVVQSELRSVPNAITVITAKQIEERGISRIDELFRGDVPGLFSLNVGVGANGDALLDEVIMFSRGATTLVDEASGGTIGSLGTDNGTNPIKTYLDGVELSDPKYLSHIDPRSIERIEILSGPQASTIYGSNAINGVMQIFTKRGSASKPQVNIGLSNGMAQNNFNRHVAPTYNSNIALSGIEGRVSYRIGGSWNYIGAWTPSKQTQRLNNDGGVRISFGRLDANISARRSFTKNKQTGEIAQTSTMLRSEGIYLPIAATSFTVTGSKTQTLLGQTLGMSLEIRSSPWWSHNLVLGYDANQNSASALPSGSSINDTTVSISSPALSRTSKSYTTTMQIPLSIARLNLTMGGDHSRNNETSWTASSLAGYSLACGSSCSRSTGKNFGMFIQGNLGFWDALFFTYGVRADWNPSLGSDAKVLPGRYGASFTHDIGRVSAKLRGSYGRSIRPPTEGQAIGVRLAGFRVPAFGEGYQILPNPELGPEYQQGGEGGMDLFFGSRGAIGVTRYNQTVDNLILIVGGDGITTGPGVDSIRSLLPLNDAVQCRPNIQDSEGHCYYNQQQYINAGSIRNQGWETTSSINLGPLATRGTYSWTKSRVLGVTPKYKETLSRTSPQIQEGRSFDFAPEHTWALGLNYSRSSSMIDLSINGVSKRYVDGDKATLSANSNRRLNYMRTRMLTLTNIGYRPIGPGYVTASLNASQRLSSRISATLNIKNLTNYYQNDVNIANPTIGRQTTIGVRIK